MTSCIWRSCLVRHRIHFLRPDPACYLHAQIALGIWTFFMPGIWHSLVRCVCRLDIWIYSEMTPGKCSIFFVMLRDTCSWVSIRRLWNDFVTLDPEVASRRLHARMDGLFAAKMRFVGLRPSGRRVPGGTLDGQQLLVVEGSWWRGRRESDSQVFCQRN